MPSRKLPVFRPLENLPSNLRRIDYYQTQRRPGDILFTMTDGLDGPVHHSSLLAPDTALYVHSVPHQGVISSTLRGFPPYLIFRYMGPEATDVSMQAAQLARGWAADEPMDAKSNHNPGKVGYSSHYLHLPRFGHGTRAVGAAFGSSKFGKGAQARLLKYEMRRKAGKPGPSNLICSEMCALAYQMACANEKKTAFINLDPKHTTPATLCQYLLTARDWQLLGVYFK